ncbi:MAG: GtrA family protein [Patescibacteria group bacterium]|jgi:putative flippase GtrA
MLFQLIRFCLVGVANTAIDFTIYLYLTRGWDFWGEQYLFANIVAFATANVFSFIINKTWTFHDEKRLSYQRQYLKFLLVSLAALSIVETCLYISVDVFGWYDLAGKAIGIALSLLVSFSLHRVWTFKK